MKFKYARNGLMLAENNLADFHADRASHEGDTVTFGQSATYAGMVIVTATMEGTSVDRLFVDVEVSQN